MKLPDGKSNKGRVQAFDGPIYVADAALYLKHHKPELGIQDPYALDRKQFDAALDLLREQRKIVGRYWHDAFIQVDDFVNEGVVASQLLAVPGEPAPEQQGAGGERRSPRKAPPAGPTRP